MRREAGYCCGVRAASLGVCVHMVLYAVCAHHRQAGSVCSVLCAGRLDSGLNGWRSARAACHARASCSADQARGGRGAVRSTRAECSEQQGCCAGCMQTAQQPCSGNVARARWPARAACRRARLAVKRHAGRVALRCGMVPEEGAGACAMGADCSERCTAARASRREWSCAGLWWCERRVAGAGGSGQP